MRRVSVAALVAVQLTSASVIAQTAPPAVAPPAALAPSHQPADLRPTLSDLIAKHNLPAMAAIAIRGDQVIARGVAGVRKQGDDTPVTIDDRWHLGSCTKAMTATLCAMLVEKGKLRWDSTLAEVFPDLAPRMHADYKPVTLAQLLTNRGGVPGDLKFDGLWGKLWNFPGAPRDARRLLLEGVVTRQPPHPPGSKYEYANAGFAIAGHMAETVAGKPFEDLITERLFGPLGMTSVGWGAPGGEDAPENPKAGSPIAPWGHRRGGEPMDPRDRAADNPSAIAPAGRAHCTMDDWARFISLHLRGGRLNPNRSCRLLSPETFDRLHTPPDDLNDYAYGWARPERAWAGPKGERFVLTHGGSNTMWFCVTWVAPKRDFAVLVCCNSGVAAAPKACDEACAALIREYLKD